MTEGIGTNLVITARTYDRHAGEDRCRRRRQWRRRIWRRGVGRCPNRRSFDLSRGELRNSGSGPSSKASLPPPVERSLASAVGMGLRHLPTLLSTYSHAPSRLQRAVAYSEDGCGTGVPRRHEVQRTASDRLRYRERESRKKTLPVLKGAVLHQYAIGRNRRAKPRFDFQTS